MRFSASIRSGRFSASIRSGRFSASIRSGRFSASNKGSRSSTALRHGRIGAFLLPLLCAGTAAADNTALRPIAIGPHAFRVEIADTPRSRTQGLMGRTHLPADRGMLFVFERPGRTCFWMRDTPLPLSIAFIDAGGHIVGLADMQPRTDMLHCPGTDARYALELRQGEFRRRGITAGAQVGGLPQ